MKQLIWEVNKIKYILFLKFLLQWSPSCELIPDETSAGCFAFMMRYGWRKNSCQTTVALSGVSSDWQRSVNYRLISLECCLNYWIWFIHQSRLILMMASCKRRICGKFCFKYYMISFNNKLNFQYNSKGKMWECVLLSIWGAIL